MRLSLLTACLIALWAPSAHAATCGHVKRPPAGGQPGTAPLAIGDSVMLGAAWKLARRGFEVDAGCGRSPAGGLHVLRNRRRKGTLSEVVVVALGTNVPVTARDVRLMLRVLGRRRTLMFVTPLRSWRPIHGGAIRRAARRRPGRVELIDWSSRARVNPQWLWSDGTHLRTSGERAYARLLHEAAWSRQRGRLGAPVA